ncbi:hypothetical protein PINS_up014562 [Pythium insidiosum]|nr:hypothetical protein PINS_up014562 [Pythium insidiosum]
MVWCMWRRGYCVNWNLETELWTHLFDELLRADPREHALVATAPLFAPAAIDDTMQQVVFEEFGFPAFCRVASAEMSVRSSAQSAPTTPSCHLVIDSGFSFTHVVPVINGRVARDAVKRVNVGGKLLTNYLKQIVSYRQYNVMDEAVVMNELKEALCYCSLSFTDDVKRLHADRNARARWLLPDFVRTFHGRRLEATDDPSKFSADPQIVEMGLERVTVPEVLFHPSDIGIEQAGLAETIMQSLALCPRETQSTLLANVLLVGGNTKLPNFAERLVQDLRPLAPCDVGIQTHSPPEYVIVGSVMACNNDCNVDLLWTVRSWRHGRDADSSLQMQTTTIAS